ncbi:hypothetical protein F8388_002909, partial [Cannabis sativa]
GQYQQCSSSNEKPNLNYRATTQLNPNEQNVELNRTSLSTGGEEKRIGSGVNGRYYRQDSSLADRYCNWYSCDRFNRSFLFRFIFWIGLIPIVIE